MCQYYYTPKCIGPNPADCGGEPNTDDTYCAQGNTAVPYDVPSYIRSTKCHESRIYGYVGINSTVDRPTYLHHVGTAESCLHPTVQYYLDGMTQRGVNAFCVEYPRSGLVEYNGGWFYQKSQWIYSPDIDTSAINVICRTPGVSCTSIVTHGFSQGSHIAMYAKKFHHNVKASLIFGGGCASGLPFSPWFTARGMVYSWSATPPAHACMHDLSSLRNHPTQLHDMSTWTDRTNMRFIGGIEDEIFGGLSEAVPQAAVVTGYFDCGLYQNCIQPDGSGYYLINAAENDGHDADTHNFFRSASHGVKTVFTQTSAPWGMYPNLDWLARRAWNLATPYVREPPNTLFALPPHSTGTYGDVCAIMDVYGRSFEHSTNVTCVDGTHCRKMSYSTANPSFYDHGMFGQCAFSSHHWMGRWDTAPSNKIAYCRDDGQCNFGDEPACSGFPGIFMGVCHGSWMPLDAMPTYSFHRSAFPGL